MGDIVETSTNMRNNSISDYQTNTSTVGGINIKTTVDTPDKINNNTEKIVTIRLKH